MVVGQVPGDGVWAGVQALVGQFVAESNDQVYDLERGRVRVGLGPSGAGLEDGLALSAVAGEHLVEPGLRDAVGGGDLGDRTVLDHNCGDQQSGRCHARTLGRGSASVRDVWRHQSGMSRDTSPGCREPEHCPRYCKTAGQRPLLSQKGPLALPTRDQIRDRNGLDRPRCQRDGVGDRALRETFREVGDGGLWVENLEIAQ